MRPHVLEISSGLDIVENISNFARKRNFGGLCVLNGSGAVSNVTLRQPSTTPGATVTFHGRFDILSISATYLPTSTVANEFGFGLAISLLGPQGQIFGGSVVGGLIASGTVFIVATSFATPSYHRLSGEEHESHQHQTTPVPVTSSACEDSHSAPSDSCGGSMSMYNSHIGSDAIWAPTARQPPPPPPPF
ncbi:hypothetical protein GIB67_019619 [Kingdonia uniflora]|nr:hypothetical protein GIB67_019619 [Kingdonia uniflora]